VVSPLTFLLQNSFLVSSLGYDVVPFLQRGQPILIILAIYDTLIRITKLRRAATSPYPEPVESSQHPIFNIIFKFMPRSTKCSLLFRAVDWNWAHTLPQN
jgi:hypothetical protein